MPIAPTRPTPTPGAGWTRSALPHADPAAEWSPRQGGETIEERIEVVAGAADHIAAQGHQIGLKSHQVFEHRLKNLRAEKGTRMNVGQQQTAQLRHRPRPWLGVNRRLRDAETARELPAV